MTNQTPPSSSPFWSPTTKLIFGLAFAAILIVLLFYFRLIIGPLLLAIILAYALHPVVAFVYRKIHLNWRWAVNIVYLVFVVILLSLLILAGFAIVDQFQSLISILNSFTTTLPELVDNLSSKVINLGPYRFSIGSFALDPLTNQVLNTLQPLLGRVGTIVSSFATSAIATLAWMLFVLVVSYFLLAQTEKVSDEMIQLEIPGYNLDVQRLTTELRRIWNVFLRGQLIVFLLAMFIYSVVLTSLGVHFSLGIAILAGIARFVPYVGPFIVWTTTGLVALLQGRNPFGMESWQYALLVLVICIIIDQIIDNLVIPKIFGQTLGLHPAAVLVAAILAAKILGLIGIVLAAPVLASLILLSRYITRKMLDLEPWPSNEPTARPIRISWSDLISRTRNLLKKPQR